MSDSNRCSTTGCDQDRVIRDWCRGHYELGRRSGSIDVLAKRISDVNEATMTCSCDKHGKSRLRVRFRNGRKGFTCLYCSRGTDKPIPRTARSPVRERLPREPQPDLPGEVWLPVPEFEDAYEVSDHGRIKSLGRVVPIASGEKRVEGRILRPSVTTGGYPKVTLSRQSRRTTLLVHRIVLEAFVGPCPDGMEACHNDGDQTNNVPSNLRWDTHAANNRDRHRHGTYSRKEKR